MWPKKTAPLKLGDELWWELCQILTDFRNSFNAVKRTKLPIKLCSITTHTLNMLLHYLVKCSMEKIMQESCCKTLSISWPIFKKKFTVVNRTFSFPSCFFNFRFQLNILHWQQTAYVNNVTINIIIAKSLKTCKKPKWCLLDEDKELLKICLLIGCQPVKLMTEFPEKKLETKWLR